MKRALFVVVVGSLLGFSIKALADRQIGTCVTTTAVLTQMNISPAKDGGFDAVVCGTVLLQDGGETALRGSCTACTASTFGALPATCKTSWQTVYCP